MLEVRLCRGEAEVQACLRVRWTVFVEEQGVPPSLEVDEHDREPGTAHAIALWRAVPAGAARLVPQPDSTGKIGRMAVIDDARGQGLGARLLGLLEEEARRRGLRAVTLGAQIQARAFYERHGYAAVGDVFDDAGIPHIEMRKAL
jgi:predicted GNAT family N-acyltransferase